MRSLRRTLLAAVRAAALAAPLCIGAVDAARAQGAPRAAVPAAGGASAQAAPARGLVTREELARSRTAAAARARARARPRAPVTRASAFGASGRRLIVSIADRRVWWMNGRDTVFTAPVAVGKGTRLRFQGRSWTFRTPGGARRVLSKEANPVWTPPDWHYAELAADSGWTLVRLRRGAATPTPDGGRLVVRGDRVVHVRRNRTEEVIPADEEVLFGTTLYVPPEDTANRRIAGELGAFKLDIGDGYMLHGTPHKDSIGRAATHGCIRLGDQAIAYLYRAVPVGTPVYIY